MLSHFVSAFLDICVLVVPSTHNAAGDFILSVVLSITPVVKIKL